MTLQEWIPNGASWINKATRPHLDKEVVREYSQFNCKRRYCIEENVHEHKLDNEDIGWEIFIEKLNQTTFTQNNIYSFCELEDGTLVGFNESPSHGWSFPTAKWKEN